MTRYKYQTHVEGHCAACRLKYQLASPSAVLKVRLLCDSWEQRCSISQVQVQLWYLVLRIRG